MDKETVKKALEDLPEAIKTKEEIIHSLSQEIDELNLKARAIETTVMQSVTKADDGEGKLIYSNDTKRRLETQRRLSDHNEHCLTIKAAVDLKKKLDEESIRFSFLKRRFRAIEAFVRLGD